MVKSSGCLYLNHRLTLIQDDYTEKAEAKAGFPVGGADDKGGSNEGQNGVVSLKE